METGNGWAPGISPTPNQPLCKIVCLQSPVLCSPSTHPLHRETVTEREIVSPWRQKSNALACLAAFITQALSASKQVPLLNRHIWDQVAPGIRDQTERVKHRSLSFYHPEKCMQVFPLKCLDNVGPSFLPSETRLPLPPDIPCIDTRWSNQKDVQ